MAKFVASEQMKNLVDRTVQFLEEEGTVESRGDVSKELVKDYVFSEDKGFYLLFSGARAGLRVHAAMFYENDHEAEETYAVKTLIKWSREDSDEFPDQLQGHLERFAEYESVSMYVPPEPQGPEHWVEEQDAEYVKTVEHEGVTQKVYRIEGQEETDAGDALSW